MRSLRCCSTPCSRLTTVSPCSATPSFAGDLLNSSKHQTPPTAPVRYICGCVLDARVTQHARFNFLLFVHPFPNPGLLCTPSISIRDPRLPLESQPGVTQQSTGEERERETGWRNYVQAGSRLATVFFGCLLRIASPTLVPLVGRSVHTCIDHSLQLACVSSPLYKIEQSETERARCVPTQEKRGRERAGEGERQPDRQTRLVKVCACMCVGMALGMTWVCPMLGGHILRCSWCSLCLYVQQ